jgi:CRISPR/Cas system-associated exonuclease Cas4 (RecB family)
VLETRNLDFKRVILISANEGTLPSGRTANTLIPYNLKRAFGIPTFHEKNAVYAYNFYRLLQRADEIYLLYNTESDGMGKGSPSRFILQVRRELAERYPNNITLHEEVLSANNSTNIESNTLSHQKDPLTIQRLKEMAEKGFSPSALNKYRNCPLKFYFENVLGIKEIDQVNEDLEQNELGTHIHAILQTIYTKGIGQPVQINELQQALTDLDSLLKAEFDKDFQHGRSHEGRNHFLESVAKTQITNFLQSEIKNIEKGDELTIIELEKPLSHQLAIETAEGTTSVNIAGIADRIDLCNGTIRVLDYKSGKVEEKDLRVKDAEPNWAEVSDKWFQVMLYTWLFHYEKQSPIQHRAGIIPLSHLHSKILLAEWEGADYMTENHLSTFEEILKEIVSDILNPQIPFIANTDSKMCSYCPFAETCNLESNNRPNN